MTDDEMWRATVDCDFTCDGVFYYAVKTVGAYCRPSCKSRTPLRKNVLFFTSAEAAEAAGFRPCKRCRPDIKNYAPTTKLAEDVKNLIDEYYLDREHLADEMKNIGASKNHLASVFKQAYTFPPNEYLNEKRLEYAKKQLQETEAAIISIAGDIGFESLSAFYAFFKKRTNITPGEFRRASNVYRQTTKKEI